ncbi:hypothetical protein [Rubrivivax rivuli]|uniref:Uncharacterized protein n=1 Tax=Rubrivivax rivuli TaxID=1862385 RepID=A0A437RI91_9BURK|nr:hypothetical protein [Rubrivivax rivuli]RVU46502.1 hypothetical protein EOE66_11830 [Rubrivivax rivuli]
MSHWTERAQTAANAEMGAGAADAPVVDCEDRTWEPMADILELPDWQPIAEVKPIGLDELHAGPPAAPAPAQNAG